MTTITAAERLPGSAPSSAFASLTPSEPEAPTATIQGMGPLSDRGAKTLGSAIGVLPSNHRREHKELSAADAQAPYQRWTLHRPFQPIGKAKTAKDVACAKMAAKLAVSRRPFRRGFCILSPANRQTRSRSIQEGGRAAGMANAL